MRETNTSSGPGESGNTRADVHRDPGGLALDELALAGVQARPDLNAEILDGVGDCDGGTDRPRGSIERREEPVTGGVELAPAETGELAAHDRVVLLDDIPPGAVAQFSGPRRRTHDVGEEHRRQQTIGLRGLPAPRLQRSVRK